MIALLARDQVAALGPPALYMILAASLIAASVADFAGKRVNIGNPGSGTRVLAPKAGRDDQR